MARSFRGQSDQVLIHDCGRWPVGAQQGSSSVKQGSSTLSVDVESHFPGRASDDGLVGLTWLAEPIDLVFLVRPSGFEPETCGLRVRCSAVELEAQRRV
jgi:hypothetical protein